MSRINLAELRAKATRDLGPTVGYKYAERVAHAEAVLALVEAVEAAQTLVDYHRDFLGLPVLSEENLDAVVEQWTVLRQALEPFGAAAGAQGDT